MEHLADEPAYGWPDGAQAGWAGAPSGPELGGFTRIGRLVQDAVHQAVGDDPDPSDPLRGLYITDEHANTLAADAPSAVSNDRLDDAALRLGLDELDTAIVGLVAAPDVVPGYGRLYAYLHDDVTRKLPSSGLVAQLLDRDFGAPAALARLAHDAYLRRVGAVRVLDERGELPVQDRPLRIADSLAGFLVGADVGGTPTARSTHHAPGDAPLGRGETVAEIARHVESGGRLPLVVRGPDAAALIAQAVGRPVLTVPAASLLDRDARHELVLGAMLDGHVLCLDGVEDGAPEDRMAIASAITDLPVRAFVACATPGASLGWHGHPLVLIDVPEPTYADRVAAWSWHSGVDEVAGLAAKFRLSIGQIVRACELAADAAAADGSAVAAAHLEEGARQASAGSLSELAQRVRSSYTWDQLVLPEQPLAMLRSIFAFLRHRDTVLSDWGYERALAQNQGIKVLFAGDSGTGKTMAAQVLAAELGLEIFRVDLATTVSKYIGETEKNLDRIFAAAEGSNAMLFFDEADALFGRRSDVGDAHDRYANLETAYLLQRMEGYPGAVILATNFRQNIDEAFLRRLDVVIDFPFPDEQDRERIWRIALPDAAPVADDLDLAFLATRFKLSGGGIRNASLAGAFLAADDGGVIRMEHLVQGVANEYAKLGRLTMETEFERFHGLVSGRSELSSS